MMMRKRGQRRLRVHTDNQRDAYVTCKIA